MLIYALLGLFLTSLIFIYIENKEKKRLISDAKTFISKNQAELIKFIDNPEYKITNSLENVKIYLFKNGDLYLRSIHPDTSDLYIKDVKYASLERFKNYMQDYFINSKSKIEFFRYRGNYHLYFPYKISDFEIIMLVFEKKMTSIEDLIRR